MNYFRCIISEDREENFKEIIDNNAFIFNDNDPPKTTGDYNLVVPDDIIFLQWKSNYVAYGKVMKRHKNIERENWDSWIWINEWKWCDISNKQKGISNKGVINYLEGNYHPTVKMLINKKENKDNANMLDVNIFCTKKISAIDNF